jgi:hypothetical protein
MKMESIVVFFLAVFAALLLVGLMIMFSFNSGSVAR